MDEAGANQPSVVAAAVTLGDDVCDVTGEVLFPG